MMITLRWLALGLSAPIVLAQANRDSIHSPGLDLSCSGPVYARAVQLWETVARPYFTKQIQDGLNRQGDVYVLYYAQEELQSFVEMTRRCKSAAEVNELAILLNLAFKSLRALPSDSTSRGWVCLGGDTCTEANKLLGQEVQLCSAQFLGLLGALATNIVESSPPQQRTQAEETFLSNASSAMVTQLNRWLSPTYSAGVSARLAMTPESVKDGSSRYFFSEKDLWMMTTLSDLAELYQAGAITAPGTVADFKQLQLKHQVIAMMFRLFLTRITLTNTSGSEHAMLDKGYESWYAENAYARYTADSSPVECYRDSLGQPAKRYRVPPAVSYVDSTMGWDISHSRRLVPALATLARNRSTLARVFGDDSEVIDARALQRAFARQIEDTIWNGDRQWPLFSNFWDGQNGWYRAGYDNGTGDCRPGQGPYSLSGSFATGGYLQWGVTNPTLRLLGERLYRLLSTDDPQANLFMTQHYAEIGAAARVPSDTQQLWRMTFFADLVGTR